MSVRLTSLRVFNVRCIREADFLFGSGLNVLFGPNDLGKTTLAGAIRDVLLLSATSAEARTLVTWGTQHVPKIDLVFEAKDAAWRLSKEYAEGKRGVVSLRSKGAGRTWQPVDGTPREHEAKIRELLSWGLPEPGKGRTTRDSFLTTALLAEQGKVHTVLRGCTGTSQAHVGAQC